MPALVRIRQFGSGESMILIPGWGWPADIWLSCLTELAKKFRVFLIEFPAWMEETVEANYSLDDLVQAIVDQVPLQAIWLGWSFGGLVAWHAAIHYARHVAYLITVASSPCFIAKPDWPGFDEQALQTFKHALRRDVKKTLRHFIYQQLDEKEKSFLPHLIAIHQKAPAPNSQLLLHDLTILANSDFRDSVSCIRCQQHHIFAERDSFTPPQLAQHTILQKNSTVITNSGHLPFITQQKAFLTRLFHLTQH